MSKRLGSVKRLTRAFTLVELLIVVAVIAVLASMLMPVISKVNEQNRTLTCVNNMRAMAGGVMAFAANNEGRVPGGAHHNTGSGSSIAWQEILNAEAFAGKNAVPRLYGSGSGTKANYACPNAMMNLFVSARRQLVMNGTMLAGNNSPLGVDVTPGMRQAYYNYRGINLDTYRLGAKLSVAKRASQKILIVEAEAPRDTGGGNALIAMDPAYSPTSAGTPGDSQGAYSFRHPGLKLNAVFCDGHVETIPFSPTAMKPEYWTPGL